MAGEGSINPIAAGTVGVENVSLNPQTFDAAVNAEASASKPPSTTTASDPSGDAAAVSSAILFAAVAVMVPHIMRLNGETNESFEDD